MGYSIRLSASDSSLLEAVHRDVRSASPLQNIFRSVEQGRNAIEQKDFAPLYAGILLAKHGRVPDSRSTISTILHENSFARAFDRHLQRYGSIAPVTKAFQKTGPYNAWMKTEFYRRHREGVIKAVTDHAMIHQPRDKTNLKIMDVGTGNGVLIADIILGLAEKMDMTGLDLVLVDQSSEMLRSAQDYCGAKLRFPITIRPYLARVEDMTPDHFAEIGRGGNCWFINASASLHHMPSERKMETLAKLKGITQNIFVSEFEANHDLPEEDSPQLVYSVAQHYKYYFDDVEKCSASSDEKESCISDFLLAEALTILANTRENRVDYHAPCSEWREIAERSGCGVLAELPLVELEDRLLTYFLHLSPRERI